ncbi:hypothetical protein FGO68_gene19 [Halteria grandinella]|uniref:Uncharacterized protein n=1 Tax=Halteria grandinella TaxID=5974 RepID=A0A8J8P6Y8_HALGN|nr:hypothetical protein FGO68_gene19 [Halteria grandinella]
MVRMFQSTLSILIGTLSSPLLVRFTSIYDSFKFLAIISAPTERVGVIFSSIWPSRRTRRILRPHLREYRVQSGGDTTTQTSVMFQLFNSSSSYQIITATMQLLFFCIILLSARVTEMLYIALYFDPSLGWNLNCKEFMSNSEKLIASHRSTVRETLSSSSGSQYCGRVQIKTSPTFNVTISRAEVKSGGPMLVMAYQLNGAIIIMFNVQVVVVNPSFSWTDTGQVPTAVLRLGQIKIDAQVESVKSANYGQALLPPSINVRESVCVASGSITVGKRQAQVCPYTSDVSGSIVPIIP